MGLNRLEKQLLVPAPIRVALVGNPNCGKTTLFNALTGAKQKVGNWPGVTVERKSGSFLHQEKTIEVIDLPGIYALNLCAQDNAIDESIACQFILQMEFDLIINIVDAANLERHLYLTTQLLEMGAPVIVAVNMIDVAKANGIEVDAQKLGTQLKCPVIALQANKQTGIHALKQILTADHLVPQNLTLSYPTRLQNAITTLTDQLNQTSVAALNPHIRNEWLALCLLEDNGFAKRSVDAHVLTNVAVLSTQIQEALQEDIDILCAETRYQFIQTTLTHCVVEHRTKGDKWTAWIDNIVLNRFLGLPIFLLMMYALFFFSINIGGAFQDFFDISSQTLFVDGFAYYLNQINTPTWLTVLLANGVGKGINTTITFIPVIGALFLFLAFLEDSGYMARAAFVVDRFMRALGLPGKAFVPMIVGFGCNVPGVMAARSLENKRDRILTIMMSPFMSCGARLAIFAVFTAAFFPRGGHNIVFALYLIGIAMAVFTGFLLRQTFLKGDPAPLIMELPLYHRPQFKTLLLHTWQRLKGFVVRAGKLIVPICIVIGVLNSITLEGIIVSAEGDTHSILSFFGKILTPLFMPMGIRMDNWPATVGLLTGILAKEVVVGTLNTLYTQMGQLSTIQSAESFSLVGGLQDAWHSIFTNFAALKDAWQNPVLAKAPIDEVSQGVYGLMYQKFDGKVGAFSYLLFVLLYFPCVSTTAAMLRELNRGWAIFSVLWMSGVAYGAAVLFYQAATILQHPLSSSLWILGISAVLLTTMISIRSIAYYTDQQKPTHALRIGESA
ncbi:MAG: Fe(2+) transporter permease subunit FeoB [Gammaproteobacteria bacterium]|nr:Fe(2+) transporter permease subunit FeoB [Gammaproteobacteria bacterium]